MGEWAMGGEGGRRVSESAEATAAVLMGGRPLRRTPAPHPCAAPALCSFWRALVRCAGAVAWGTRCDAMHAKPSAVRTV